jgi:cellulose synthase (UDP-forming)
MGLHSNTEKYTKEVVIPRPPGKSEYYYYLGKQPLRLLSIFMFCLSLGSVYGIWAIFSLTPILYPLLLTLLVLIPWSAYVILLATIRPRVTYESHEQVKAAGPYMLKTSVDVFVPVLGEDLAIIRNTLHHVSQMKWPGTLNVYCLDDGDSEEVKHLAEEYCAHYLVRDNRPLHLKSGNLNNGLLHSSGEFVVVFDADFAPAEDFLLETVPYMLYQNMGIVQTPQYFDIRLDETRNWIQQLSGSLQDVFSCWAQPARNTSDSAMCIGTNAVYRRKALDAIGGFPKVDAGGEDVITGLDMYAKGYRTIFLPVILAKGVCPDSFNTTISQQHRWSLTSMKMFIGKNPYSHSFWQAPLKFSQRLVYWSAGVYYMQSILVLITSVLPSIIMLWMFPALVTPWVYLPIAPAMLGMFALPLIIRGWRPSTVRLITVYSVAHLLAAIDMVKGRSVGWQASGTKRKSSDLSYKAGWTLRIWVIVTQGLQLIALFHDVPIYGLSNYWVAIVLCLFQAIILFPLLLPGYGTIAQPALMPHLVKRYLWYVRSKKAYAAANSIPAIDSTPATYREDNSYAELDR